MKSTTPANAPSRNLPPPAHRGKVRDVYDLGEELVLVATDRVSAFDCVLPNLIPDKGRILTGLSEFWFEKTRPIVKNHLLSTELADFPAPFCDEPSLAGRSMWVKKAKRIDVECVVRGYLAGSAFAEYSRTRRVMEHELPAGLTKGARLPVPLFTPTTKEEKGHDQPITFEEMERLVGGELARDLRRLSLAVYAEGVRVAEESGFLIADTKLEFGIENDGVILIDEVLTPDSSRYWRAADWKPGVAPESWDKQVIRDYLEGLDWNKQPPAPTLPEEIVRRARERYLDVYSSLTGKSLD
jgi:phosphoribosylaminoimidazole-succinocarboxamide synthase